MDKEKQKELIEEVKTYTKSRSNTFHTMLDDIRILMIANELERAGIEWRCL